MDFYQKSKMNKKKLSGCAHPGNKYGVKLKDCDIRQEAFRQYCQHLALGYPKESFFFDHPSSSVCWKTMERYIAESPAEFPPYLIEKAKAARYKHWFNEGQILMKGGYKFGSPVVWQTIMRNMFKDVGWDRLDEKDKENAERAIDPRLENISKQLEEARKALVSSPAPLKDKIG